MLYEGVMIDVFFDNGLKIRVHKDPLWLYERRGELLILKSLPSFDVYTRDYGLIYDEFNEGRVIVSPVKVVRYES
jgi:hypothetical protein